MIVFPQLILDDVLRKFLDILRDEIEAKQRKNSILDTLFGQTSRFRRDYYKEAVDLFERSSQTHSRFIDVRLMFDRERAKIPTIHLTVPSDEEFSPGINNHEGYVDPIISEDGRTSTPVFTRMFRGRFNVVFTSDNERECVMMYEVFRAMLLSASTHLELSGLKNIKFGGQDLSINPDLIPAHIYMKMMTITCVYEVNALSLECQSKINQIFINRNSRTNACK